MTEVDFVENVLLALQGNNTEKKIEAITKLEDELLEETPLEPQEIAQLVPALRDALKGSQQQVSYVALICLNPFISLIAETHPTFFKNVVITFAAAVIDKLGDTRDKARDAALNVLLTMWISAASSGSVITTPLATIIKETAFGHKQWRAREQILQWIVNCTRRVSDFSIKQWLPYMVKLLEDPHEQVRETAKDRIVLLFSGAAAHAKLDLKRELEKHSVRAAITEYILSKMGSNYGEANDIDNLPDNMTEPIEEDYMNVGTQNEETSRQVEAIRPSSSADDIGVIRIESAKELEKEFQNLLTPFSGKESEQNWLIREKNINKLRSLTRGDAASQYPDAFMNGLKLIMGGILTSLTSLRTTLTLAASGLIKDLVSHLGTTMDPFADNLLANLLKMVQSTKKIVAQAATNSTNALFQYCSYHTRLVTQLWHAMEEKNIQLRTSTIGFVKIVIQTHADRRDTMERTGGVESLEKCVRKGLTDAAPKVREGCREVFWTFFEVWPERGEKILKNLEPAVKKKLERDRPRNISLTPLSSTSTTSSPPRRSITPAPKNRARSSSIGKSRRSSIPRSDSGASDNYSMSVDSPKSHIKSPVSNPSTLRSKSPAPPSMRSKSTTSKSPMKPSPNKNGSPNATQIQPRKLTIVEQLEHSDWTTRVEGLFNVAQFVVKRSLEPPSANKPGYDFKKTPLPPDEELGPILLNMLNDQNPKVIENFLAPNVITEMARVIRLENLIPRLILFANDDDKSEQSIIIQNLFPGVKNAIGTEHALLGLNKCLLLLNNSGTTQKKSSSGFVYTLPQKRKILNGLLVWFNEIIEPKLELVENDQELTGFLGDVDKYSLLTKRLIPLVNNTKETSENYEPLSRLLINLHKLDPDAFETILFSFEGKVVDLVGNMVGWEEELEEAEEEVLAEEQAKLKEEQEREWEQQQLERRLYEEQFIADQKNQLALLQQQQQEQLEKQQRERELKKQREREAQLRREREAQEQRERELQLQKEHEEQQQREHELQQQRLRELQQQREQKQQERELQKQKERELQKQRELEFQQQQREFELQQQREFELQQQREFELQQQRELELQHQRELELQKQREFEIQQQREIEIQQEREFELQQRELEIQQQREAELQRQREFELHQQHEYELHEREYEREMQSHLYARRPPPLQLQSSNKFSSQNSPLSQKNIIKDNINDWVENQRVPHLSQRGDDLRNPKEKDILREQEWARKNRPKTAEPHWLDPRPRDIDRARRAKTPTRENEYERRMYRENGNWDERERIKSRDTDMYERDDRYDDRRREFELDERGRRPLNDERSRMIKDKTPYKENSWNEKDRRMTREYEYDERDRRVPRESREHEVNGRNQRFLRDSREDELDGRDRRPFPRGSNQNDFDERLGGKRSFKSSKSPDWDDKNGRPILKERDIRDNEWDDVSSRSSGKERDNDWEERSTRSVPRDLRDGDLDEKLSQHSSRDKRDQEWDDRMNRLRPRESRESLEGKNTRPSPRFPRDNDSDEKSLKASPRDPRKNDWDERNPYRDNGSSNNKAPVRGPEWSDKGRNMSRDSDWNESTDRPSEAHEDEDIISEFDLNQPEKSNIKTRDHNSKPVDRVVSLPPPPHDLGYPEFDDKDLELANLKQLVEKLDMEEEEDINDENVPENFTDMTISRPDSIYISEDVWTQLENTMNGKMNNPFYLNPEERFKNDNNGADAKLAPIQEDELAELPELTHVEEKSKSLDDVSFQVTDNDRVLQSTVSETVTGNSPKPELPNTDSEIIEETSITDKKVLSSINTETIPEEPSPTNMPISNVSASELPLPASPVSSVGSGNSISGARDRALRRAERFNSGSPLPGAAQERRILLATLLARLHGYDTDVHLFRKLIRISKETQFSNRELAEDIWENGDRFIELMNALIGFLSDSEQQNNELREGAVLLLGQLINNQPDYTRGQERDILRILLECRADSASNICGHADDALDNYIQIVDANFGLYALIDIMESSLFNTFGNTSLPESNSPQFGSKTSMKGSAFVVLSKLVKRFDKRSLERQVGRVVPLAIKGFSDSKPEIRKSVVDALVAIYSVIGDDNTLFQYLGSLNAAQQNLLKYYFDKSRKQRRATSSPGRGVRV